MSERLSVRAYARHRNVSQAAVQKAIKAGRITKGDDGLIDVAAADAAWQRNSSPAPRSSGKKGQTGQVPPAGNAADANPESGESAEAVAYAAARARRELALAKRAEAETEEYLGNLMTLEDVEKDREAILKALVTMLRNQSRRMAADLVAAKLITPDQQRAALRILEENTETTIAELQHAGDDLETDGISDDGGGEEELAA